MNYKESGRTRELSFHEGVVGDVVGAAVTFHVLLPIIDSSVHYLRQRRQNYVVNHVTHAQNVNTITCRCANNVATHFPVQRHCNVGQVPVFPWFKISGFCSLIHLFRIFPKFNFGSLLKPADLLLYGVSWLRCTRCFIWTSWRHFDLNFSQQQLLYLGDSAP